MRDRSLIAAKDFLTRLLKDGPRKSIEIIQEIATAGISERTIRTAKMELGITSSKTGGKGSPWKWSMPAESMILQPLAESMILQPLPEVSILQPLNSGTKYMLPKWIDERLREADQLALAAREKALAGDQAEAENLRDQHDKIYSEILQKIDSTAKDTAEKEGTA